AVVFDAEGLDTAAMQAIAAEFNYSETTFVLPPVDPAHLAQVRIFTPRFEMPFAGHPTVGTALALAWRGRASPGSQFVLEEKAGPVPVRLSQGEGGSVSAEFTAPQLPWHSSGVAAQPIACALGLAESDLITTLGLPRAASCGVPFLLVELASTEALGRAVLHGEGFLQAAETKGVFLFVRRSAGDQFRARMFAPGAGIVEDPATGSAAAALAGYLGGRPGLADGWHSWDIRQGVEMGRPSLIATRARREGERVVEVRVGGTAVPVMEGTLEAGA
ncbi:MAG: PhzF family phenazine biosynthesis protein, partial [Geminicoccaceae bacterium]